MLAYAMALVVPFPASVCLSAYIRPHSCDPKVGPVEYPVHVLHLITNTKNQNKEQTLSLSLSRIHPPSLNTPNANLSKGACHDDLLALPSMPM
jgi:hypothetical protein